MKLRTLLSPVFALSLVAGFLTACESEKSSSGEDFQITPSYKEIGVGKSVTLTATGADNYTWSLESGGVGGGLSATKGSSVVYTSPSTLTANGTQVISVIGICAGNQSTNNAFKAQATISVLIKEEEDLGDVKIAGNPQTLVIGESCVLSATGGKERYSWCLLNDGGKNNGSLSLTSGDKTTFTAKTPGDQRIRVVSGKSYDLILIKCVEKN